MTDFVALVTTHINEPRRATLIQTLAHVLSLLPTAWTTAAFDVVVAPDRIAAFWPDSRLIVTYHTRDPADDQQPPHYRVRNMAAWTWPQYDTPEEVADYIRSLPAPAQ